MKRDYSKVYKRDYSNVLACVPRHFAQDLMDCFGVEDTVETLEIGGAHIFRDDLLYLMDIPMHEVMMALDSHVYTLAGYPSLYCGMPIEKYEKHFQNRVRPILITRLKLGV
jgi:hypothetical protein